MKKELRKYTNSILLPKHSCRFPFRPAEYCVVKNKARYTKLLSTTHAQLCPCCEKGRFRWNLCREGSYVRKERGRKVLETMFCPRETGRTSDDTLLSETTLSNTGSAKSTMISSC